VLIDGKGTFTPKLKEVKTVEPGRVRSIPRIKKFFPEWGRGLFHQKKKKKSGYEHKPLNRSDLETSAAEGNAMQGTFVNAR